MSYDVSVGNEEENDRKQPKDNVRRTSLDRRSEKLRNDDDQDLRQSQVEEAKLLAQFLAVGLDVGLSTLQRSIVCRAQESSPA